jgi:hypothetical protein
MSPPSPGSPDSPHTDKRRKFITPVTTPTQPRQRKISGPQLPQIIVATTPSSLEPDVLDRPPATPGYDNIVQLYGAGPVIGSPMSPTLNAKQARLGDRRKSHGTDIEHGLEVEADHVTRNNSSAISASLFQLIEELSQQSKELKERALVIDKVVQQMKDQLNELSKA